MSLQNMGKNKGGNSKGGSSFSIPVMVVDAKCHDPKQPVPAEDYATVYALADAGTIKAEFDAEGRPLTELRLMMNDKTAVKNRPEVYHLQPGKKMGMSEKMGNNPTIILENAYFDERTNTVKARWFSVAKRDNDNALEACVVDTLVTVDQYRESSRDADTVYQSRYSLDPKRARNWDSKEALYALAEEFLQVDQNGGGKPGMMLRIMNPQSIVDGTPQIDTTTIYRQWDKDLQGYPEIKDVMDKWFEYAATKEGLSNWIGYVDEAQDPAAQAFVFEAMPIQQFATGPFTLKALRDKGRDEHDPFKVVTRVTDDGREFTGNAFAKGTHNVKRTSEDNDNWFATATHKESYAAPLYMRSEVISACTPGEVAAIWEQKAKDRTKAKLDGNKAAVSQSKPAAKEDDEIPFGADGEPDHSGGRGLTPS